MHSRLPATRSSYRVGTDLGGLQPDPCYHTDMQLVARSLCLLLLAVAVMLPTAARTSARTEVLIAAATTTVQSATRFQPTQTAMKCLGCFGKVCGASAATCGVYCGAASALTPLAIVLMAVTSLALGPAIYKVARDHSNPPDPHPPRPIRIG